MPVNKTKRGTPTPGRGLAWQWWLVIGVVLAAGVGGVALQSSRSKTENATVVTPKHGLGPDGSEITGDPAAPVIVDEYADFQCPSCKGFHDDLGATIDRLVAEKKIRFAYHYFPFIGEESFRSAAAAVCAGDEGKFLALYNLLYAEQAPENSGALTPDALVRLDRDAGITGSAAERYSRCVRAGTYDGWVRKQADAASQRGITQTPTVFVNGRALTGTEVSVPAEFERAVTQAVGKAAGT